MSSDVGDRFAAARAVADAVLYEGYVLYPYRASSRKNQLRWQFGVLTPRSYSEAEGSERWSMRTECLYDPGGVVGARTAPILTVRIRCLQVQHRTVEASVSGAATGEFRPVERLEVGGAVHVAWDEAVDQVIDMAPVCLGERHEEHFTLSGGRDTELLGTDDGGTAGRLVRRREQVDGRVLITAEGVDGESQLVKVTVTVDNTTPWTGRDVRRDEVMGHSLVAVHTMLATDDGTWVSLLDPPDAARAAAAGCHNDGVFPVLIGDDHVVLASPIILYDHPQVAPESPGDLYDATEIDEILALRVLTMTDEEKSEARGTDARAAAIIDRCDDLAPEIWERLHGAVRSLGPEPADTEPEPAPWWDPAVDASADPWTDTVVIAGVEVAKGASVRLRPSHRADAQDIFLGGMDATVAGVFTDVDGTVQVAVTVDDDPATDELVWQGRYLFFHLDEVEPVAGPGGSR